MNIDSQRLLEENKDGSLRIYNENGRHHEGGNMYFLISKTHPNFEGGPWHYSGMILKPLGEPINESLMGDSLLVDSEPREEIHESRLITRSGYHSLLKRYPKLRNENLNL